MFRHLQIPYRKERWLVGVADAGLRAARLLGWPRVPGATPAVPPRRILLLRLERVGDLIMVLDAIALVRALAPHATIDLVVGTWNRALAGLVPSVNAVETLDAPWLAREGSGLTWSALVARARAWRRDGYDLAINFEADIRSNLLIALSGATRRVGFESGGGGSLLTDAIAPDPGAHIADNARALVGRALAVTGVVSPSKNSEEAPGFNTALLNIPEAARRAASELVGTATRDTPIVGIQPATGRRVKEWDPVRFAQVGAELARTRGARVVLIGSAADQAVLDAVRAAWPGDVPLDQLPLDVDLIVLAGVLERLSLFITGDTGPMHLAAAVGTRVLAVFGPSLPTRYAPLSRSSRIVRIDIHCSPCNLMRQPPARCVGHVPECLAGISTSHVLGVANEMLDAS